MQTFLYIISAVFMFNSVILVGRKSFTLGLAIMVAIIALVSIVAVFCITGHNAHKQAKAQQQSNETLHPNTLQRCIYTLA